MGGLAGTGSAGAGATAPVAFPVRMLTCAVAPSAFRVAVSMARGSRLAHGHPYPASRDRPGCSREGGGMRHFQPCSSSLGPLLGGVESDQRHRHENVAATCAAHQVARRCGIPGPIASYRFGS